MTRQRQRMPHFVKTVLDFNGVLGLNIWLVVVGVGLKSRAGAPTRRIGVELCDN